MAKFRIEGQEFEFSEHLRIGELCEAEQALGVQMDAGTGAKMAVMLFISLRKAQPNKLVSVIAGEVMRADIAAFEEVEDSPPVAAPEGANGTAPASLETSGTPHSEPTSTLAPATSN